MILTKLVLVVCCLRVKFTIAPAQKFSIDSFFKHNFDLQSIAFSTAALKATVCYIDNRFDCQGVLAVNFQSILLIRRVDAPKILIDEECSRTTDGVE